MSTCLDAAGVKHPRKFGEHQVQPVEGVSLLPAVRGGALVRKDAAAVEAQLLHGIDQEVTTVRSTQRW